MITCLPENLVNYLFTELVRKKEVLKSSNVVWLKAGWRQKAMKREANYPKSLESMQDVHHVIFFLPFSDQMLQIPASVHGWALQ